MKICYNASHTIYGICWISVTSLWSYLKPISYSSNSREQIVYSVMAILNISVLVLLPH